MKSVIIWLEENFIFTYSQVVHRLFTGITGFSTAFTIVIHIIPKVIHIYRNSYTQEARHAVI